MRRWWWWWWWRGGHGETEEGADRRRPTAQGEENGRGSDATAGGMAARQESLRDQEGWRVNDYTRSQYLTGPRPCPSVLHPDSTEGRAKNLAIVSPA